MRNCTFQYWNTNQVLLSGFYTLSNCSCNFTCLTKTPTNDTIFVSNNNNCREAKCSTTLSYLSNTVDSNQSIF